MVGSTRRAFVLGVGASSALSSGNVRRLAEKAPEPEAAARPRAGKVAIRVRDSARTDSGAGPGAGSRKPFRAADFGIVGQYSADWLLDARLQRLLDNMAASTAFSGVRFFHALDSGERASTIDDDPLQGGIVWPDPAAPMDFSRTFAALETLTSRGLVPFVGLLFFPKAVSAHAATPPRSFDPWKQLVRRFLDELAAHRSFGPDAIRDWWFEVWNEPNGAPFWKGTYNPGYFELYRATSEAVIASGHPVRLGGPAIVYRRDTPETHGQMRDFLAFASREPALKFDFISFHAKGVWSSSEEPDFRNPYEAAIETAELARSIDPIRFSNLPIVNNEADMRVGFDIPFEARMDERFSAWLCSLAIAYDALNAVYAGDGFRFVAASDNANQQLVRESFDGRRSIMTAASASPRDLLKLPVFNLYEVLRLLEGVHGTIESGANAFFPNSDLFHLVTAAETHIAAVFSVHPRTRDSPLTSWRIEYALADIPWQRVNIARFRIDRTASNSYAAAGRANRRRPFPEPAEAARIRQAQELASSQPIEHDVRLSDATLHEALELEPFTVFAYWITPVLPDAPRDPVWLEAHAEDGNVVLRWRPNAEPFLYSYEVYLIGASGPHELITPVPLRSAMWVDTAPPRGVRTYGVRAVSASGVASRLALSMPVAI